MKYKTISGIEGRLQHIKSIKQSIFFIDILEKIIQEEKYLIEKLNNINKGVGVNNA